MNSTQSIIVYRNPLEQQLWENPASLFPIFAGIVVFFAVFLAINWLADKKLHPFSNTRRTVANASLWIAAVLAFATIFYLA